MTAPYKRIVILHLTIIFGGGLAMMVKSTAPALVILIVLKIIADLHAHRREHQVTAPVAIN